MKQSRFTEEQIIGILREQDVLRCERCPLHNRSRCCPSKARARWVILGPRSARSSFVDQGSFTGSRAELASPDAFALSVWSPGRRL